MSTSLAFEIVHWHNGRTCFLCTSLGQVTDLLGRRRLYKNVTAADTNCFGTEIIMTPPDARSARNGSNAQFVLHQLYPPLSPVHASESPAHTRFSGLPLCSYPVSASVPVTSEHSLPFIPFASTLPNFQISAGTPRDFIQLANPILMSLILSLRLISSPYPWAGPVSFWIRHLIHLTPMIAVRYGAKQLRPHFSTITRFQWICYHCSSPASTVMPNLLFL